MAFRIVLTESHSAVGRTIANGFESESFALFCPPLGSLDWSDVAAVQAYLEQTHPVVLINTLVFSEDVDVQAASVGLAALCLRMDLTVIHLSSHGVFSSELGSAGVQQACGEADLPSSNTPWAQHFQQVEQAFTPNPRTIVLRLPWLLDEPHGMLDRVCRALLTMDEVGVSDRWRGCPLPKAEIARAVVAMVKQILCGAENWGVMHLHTADACTEAEFADMLARLLSKSGRSVAKVRIVPPEQRMFESNGWLEGERCTNNFGIQLRSWRLGMKAQVSAWLEAQTQTGVHVAPE